MRRNAGDDRNVKLQTVRAILTGRPREARARLRLKKLFAGIRRRTRMSMRVVESRLASYYRLCGLAGLSPGEPVFSRSSGGGKPAMKFTVTNDFARRFADEWLDAWNSHDPDRILPHYAEDFEMTSPGIVELMAEPAGVLRGKAAVRAYWEIALERRPDLRFRLLDIFTGVETICISYDSGTGRNAVEWFHFNADGKVIRAMVHHSR